MTRRVPQGILFLTFVAVVGALVEYSSVRADATSPDQASTEGFKAPTFDLTVPAFNDVDLTRLLTALDQVLVGRPATASSIDDARIWDIARGLQTEQLSPTQMAHVHQALAADARRNPSSAAVAMKVRHLVDTLTVGKVAPDIAGEDLDGNEFHLSDYRGKVVALIFSGEWCGICRTQAPYERLLLELYRNWPFAMLGVDSDADRDAARQSMADRGVPYRTWWDGGGADNTQGPIATDWIVSGWPTVYILDGNGVIRFVDLRQEDLLKGVRQLLATQANAATAPAHK